MVRAELHDEWAVVRHYMSPRSLAKARLDLIEARLCSLRGRLPHPGGDELPARQHGPSSPESSPTASPARRRFFNARGEGEIVDRLSQFARSGI
jgi:hypothetical protein